LVSARAISIRLDAEAEEALQELTASGTSRSAAVRAAVIETAGRHRRRSVAEEAAALAVDATDRAEIADVRELMESLRAAG
jgi:Arc/MetJ-type ribon-helix-helix transcriptional regulator